MPQEPSAALTPIGLGGDAASAIDLNNSDASVRGPIRWLILCGVMLIAAIAFGTSTAVDSFRERALDAHQHELENTVLLLSRHFDQKLEDFGQLQKDIAAQIRQSAIAAPGMFKGEMATLAIHEMLRTKVSGSSDAARVNLFAADGALINSSDIWPVPDINIADRKYFADVKSDPESAPQRIEIIQSRLVGKWTVAFAQKIVGPNGEFLGVLSRGFDPDKFEDFFRSMALAPGAAISLYDADGTLLARHPHIDSMIGRNFRAGPVHQKVLSRSDHGTIELKSPIDGADRLASARRLSRFPISVVATTTIAAALADWREQTRLLIAAAGLIALVIVVILSLIVRQLLRMHQASRKRLDTALNNMTQGLMLYDAASRIVLFNRRYMEMYGLSPEVIRPGQLFRDVMRHRKETGSFEGDPEAFCSRVLQNVAQRKLTHTILVTTDGRSVQIVNQPLPDGGWVATHEDITELRRSEARIKRLAHYDALTDLPNRVLFREQLDREFKRAKRGEQFALLYIDIDEFKGINDSLGHPVGDDFLKSVALRLKDCIRETDFVARLGGDEFAIIQTGVDGLADVENLVAKLHQAIRQPYECLGHHVLTDASIGVAMAPADGADIDQLIKNADLAMYGAKAAGRRTCRFFEPQMDAKAKARRALELDLREAIRAESFELHYQPLVDLGSNEVTGCEALLRWPHPARGMVSPVEFIPVAEDTGMIIELGEWVLRTACAEAASWPDQVRIAVNVSPVQFRSQTLALKVASALADSGLAANRLELEITEAVLIRDDAAALEILHQLRALGVRIALDDFGTGYSSLSYLQRFPFDKIKIDRSFINDIGGIDGSSSIVQAVVTIAAARNMTTTAEGVETQQQFDLLRGLGCTQMQGFLFSAARPAGEIQAFFRSRDRTELAAASA
jgi:diguanylate cyclase (GGDEF)-like protein/PAS domain S-box-containing protein